MTRPNKNPTKTQNMPLTPPTTYQTNIKPKNKTQIKPNKNPKPTQCTWVKKHDMRENNGFFIRHARKSPLFRKNRTTSSVKSMLTLVWLDLLNRSAVRANMSGVGGGLGTCCLAISYICSVSCLGPLWKCIKS